MKGEGQSVRVGVRAVAIARSWIGTPYHHQASLKGVGTDCLGLVRGIWRELYGYECEVPPAYSADWAEAGGCETMLDAAQRHLQAVAGSDIGAGDILFFRIRRDAVVKHAALATSSHTMIHAIEGARVAEVAISPWWRRRMAAVFSFPEV